MDHVAVGSTNPVKVAATERVVAELSSGAAESRDRDRSEPTVESVGVASGVSEQPRGRAETVAGAETRARRALDQTDADFGVGIEGGVSEGDAVQGLWLIMYAAVTDGAATEHAAGPAIRLPDRIAERIRSGEELGPVLDDVFDASGIKKQGGAAGVLTDHAIDRESALAHAVAGAFGPFAVDLYE